MNRIFGIADENKAKFNTELYDTKNADRTTGSPIVSVKAAPGSDGGQAGTSSIELQLRVLSMAPLIFRLFWRNTPIEIFQKGLSPTLDTSLCVKRGL